MAKRARCDPANGCEFLPGEFGAVVCTKHARRHDCGASQCDARIVTPLGVVKCSLTGLIFALGDAAEGERTGFTRSVRTRVSDAVAASAPASAPASAAPAFERVASVAAVAPAVPKRITDTARDGIAKAVRAAVSRLSVERWCVATKCIFTFEEHIAAYVDEAERLWVAFGDLSTMPPAIHGVGCLEVMRRGLSANVGSTRPLAAPDALLVRATRSAHCFDAEKNSVLRTRDVVSGYNHVRKALRTLENVYVRPHAEVLADLKRSKERSAASYFALDADWPTLAPATARLPVRQFLRPTRSLPD